MTKKDNFKTFIDEVYTSPCKRYCCTSKVVYNHFDEIWSVDSMGMSDYKISNNEGDRFLFVVLDNVSKLIW